MATRSKPVQFLQALLALLIAYVVVVVIVRLLPAPPEQRQAVARMSQPTPPVAGRDATAAIWLQKYDVPPAAQAGVAVSLLEYYRKDPTHVHAAVDSQHPLHAFAPFPDPPTGGAGTCERREPGCLAYVRSDLDRVRATLQAHDKGLSAALALADFDGMRFGLDPANLVQAMQPYGHQRRLVPTHFAAMFATGRQQEALAATCRDLAGWRRLGADNDSLIGSMVSASVVREDVLLLAEMLSELPDNAALPPSCSEALAPTRDEELDTCPAMRTEFAALRGNLDLVVEEQMTGVAGMVARPLIHERDVLGRTAIVLSGVCGEQATRQMQADRPTRDWAGGDETQCGTFAFTVNPVGCLLLANVGGSSFHRYADRRTDQAASLALLRTIVWLRQQAIEPARWADALERRPRSLGLTRKPALSADGRSVSIPALEASADALTLPLLPAEPRPGVVGDSAFLNPDLPEPRITP